VPVMIGDEVEAATFSARLVDLGVYAVSFSYRGAAPHPHPVSAAHTTSGLVTGWPSVWPSDSSDGWFRRCEPLGESRDPRH